MNASNTKVYLFGFHKIKQRFIRCFLKEHHKSNIFFINPKLSDHYNCAIRKGLSSKSKIYIWGRKNFPKVENFAKKNNMRIIRVEDGFLRSINLGSNYTRPYSLIFDDIGIYFDSTKPSLIENTLNTYQFDKKIINDAKILHKNILQNKLSKYNNHCHKKIDLPKNKTKIFVPGQVDTDASLKYGAPSGINNLELLKRVRKENPNAFIVFKPHPDVSSGNRRGQIDNSTAMQFCNLKIDNISVASVLESVDEVHTITSLVGLEGLLYKKKVVTYGMPFYAGWGLTHDKVTEPRRNRKLSLEELIATSYILYPKYLNPNTLEYCSAYDLIQILAEKKQKNDNSILRLIGIRRIFLLRFLQNIILKPK